MAILRISRASFKTCGVGLTSTLFENAGETAVVTLSGSKNNQIDVSIYHRRHIIFKGTFLVSFPNTDEPAEHMSEGLVFPNRENYQLNNSQFTVTSLEPGSVYYCILPLRHTIHLTRSDVSLNAGDTKVLDQGTLNFIFGKSFRINGELVADRDVVACERSSAELLAETDCHVVSFSGN
jgi:hypothetical protein